MHSPSFIASLKDLVRPKDSVIPVSVHRGSVIIELSMTPRDIDRLCEAYFQRKLDPLAVVKITFPSASTPNSLGPALAGIAADYIATLIPVHPLTDSPGGQPLGQAPFSAWFKSKSGDTPNTTGVETSRRNLRGVRLSLLFSCRRGITELETIRALGEIISIVDSLDKLLHDKREHAISRGKHMRQCSRSTRGYPRFA